MKILLTNDDGYNAPGILSLYEKLQSEHRVILVAPDTERSAAGHGITFNQPLRVKKILKKIKSDNGSEVYAVSGTPVDCVKLALFTLCSTPPDIVISGINAGGNAGVNVNYSGTVAAVREAALNNLLGVAVSIEYGKNMDFHGMSRFLSLNLNQILTNGFPLGTFLNINAPAIMIKDVRGVKVTKQASNNVENKFTKRFDPRKGEYFWYDNLEHVAGVPGTDIHALEEGYISMTPIQCDVTDYKAMKKVKPCQLLPKQKPVFVPV